MAETVQGRELVLNPTGKIPYNGCSWSYQHDMAIKYEAAFGTSLGHHSSVLLESWLTDSTCTWYYRGWRESCNHGTCASSSDMAEWCRWNSPMRSYEWPAFQVYDPYGYSACSTTYDPTSALWGANCNDSTYFQVRNIRNNEYYPAATGPDNICNDSISHSWAPGCDGSRGQP